MFDFKGDRQAAAGCIGIALLVFISLLAGAMLALAVLGILSRL